MGRGERVESARWCDGRQHRGGPCVGRRNRSLVNTPAYKGTNMVDILRRFCKTRLGRKGDRLARARAVQLPPGLGGVS